MLKVARVRFLLADALRPQWVRLDPTGAVDTVLAMTVAHVGLPDVHPMLPV